MGNAPVTLGPSTGLRCGRIRPAHASARDGSFVWCIGSDSPTVIDDLEIGDEAGVEQVVDLTLLSTLSFAIRFRQSVLRRAALLRSRAGSYPTGFAGGETLRLAIDGAAPVTTTFSRTDQTLEQVAAKITRATGLTAGGAQSVLRVESTTLGELSSLEVISGTAAARLGFDVGDADTGQEIRFEFRAALRTGGVTVLGMTIAPEEGETLDFVRRTLNVSQLSGDHTLRLTAEAVRR